MRAKIKFDTGIFVTIPYKGGKVVWLLRWLGNYGYAWDIFDCPVNYSIRKVKGCHKQFLDGKGLLNKMIKSAAASQHWDHLEILKKVRGIVLSRVSGGSGGLYERRQGGRGV
jgi:hypothetical protein